MKASRLGGHGGVLGFERLRGLRGELEADTEAFDVSEGTHWLLDKRPGVRVGTASITTLPPELVLVLSIAMAAVLLLLLPASPFFLPLSSPTILVLVLALVLLLLISWHTVAVIAAVPVPTPAEVEVGVDFAGDTALVPTALVPIFLHVLRSAVRWFLGLLLRSTVRVLDVRFGLVMIEVEAVVARL